MTAEALDRPDAGAAPSPSSSKAHAPSRGLVLVRVVVCALAGLLAALIARAAIALVGDVFHLTPELAAIGASQNPSAEDTQRYTVAMFEVRYSHAALWLAAAAGILGGIMGLTLGLFRRSVAKTFVGTACGVLCGAVAGAAGGYLSTSLEYVSRTRLTAPDASVSEFMTMLWHSVAWLLVGLGCGLGTALGTPTLRVRILVGTVVVAAVAGLVAGTIYPVVAGVALPLTNASLPFPDEPQSLLLWLGLPAVLIGLTLGRRG